MVLLTTLDRMLKPRHVLLANAAALLWYVGFVLEGRHSLPSAALVRCPVGFCAGGYSPEVLYSMLDEIGEDGRAFLYGTVLRADVVLPALLLLALVVDIVWFSRSGARYAISLEPVARFCLLAVPLLYCVVDYIENMALADMLRVYPAMEDVKAERLSHLTAAKSQLFAAAAGITAALAVAAFGSGLRGGSHSPPDA